MRKKEIKCPYCGSKAKLVHFYDMAVISGLLKIHVPQVFNHALR